MKALKNTFKALRRFQTEQFSVGNRFIVKYKIDKMEVQIILRDPAHPDAYSREELYEMLKTVRKHESIQGWKCPEPTDPA